MWAVKEYNDHGEFIGATFYHTKEDAQRLIDAIDLAGVIDCVITYLDYKDSGEIYEISADEDETND